MSKTQAKWPKDLNPKDYPQFPAGLIHLTNRNRYKIRFWLSPVGLAVMAALICGFALLQALFG